MNLSPDDLELLLYDEPRRKAWYRAALAQLWRDATYYDFGRSMTMEALEALSMDGLRPSQKRVVQAMRNYEIDLLIGPIWRDPTERVQEFTESAEAFFWLAQVLAGLPREERDLDMDFLRRLHLTPTPLGLRVMKR